MTKSTRRRLSDRMPGELERLAKNLNKSQDALPLHLSPISGYMGPPTAWFQRAGLWHLVYEWSPFEPQADLVHFYHATSSDLISWKNRGVSVSPDTYFENGGLAAGDLAIHEDKLALVYTGIREDDQGIKTNQSMAWISMGGVEKWYVPIIKEGPQGYDKLQNPTICPLSDGYILLVGAQNMETGLGALLKYRSKDFESWIFEGEITGLPTHENPFTHPQVVSTETEDILLISAAWGPLGKEGQSLCGYLLGQLEGLSFSGSAFLPLDYGFDFSAPKIARDEEDQMILIANMAQEGTDYSQADPLGARAMTLPRRIFVKNDRICQWPVSQIDSLREKTFMSFQLKKIFKDDHIRFSSLKHQYALELEVGGTDNLNQVKVNLFEDEASNERVVVTWDYQKESVSLDRSRCQRRFVSQRGDLSRAPYHEQNLRLYAICDRSSLELFLGDGQVVFTSRVYTRPEARGISIEIDGQAYGISVKAWTLNIPDYPGFVL